ncbi:MAG TPA: alpha/beta fold hydrolase [Jatrophihabitans sp.]|nr:alpha/beta fold hydrolase [Jatrophihabitans sp.]
MTGRQTVPAGDGVRLTAYLDGDPAAPNTVLALHGYPDNASMWDPVVSLLAATHRVIRYDVRGAGRSDAPAGRSGYRLAQLAADAEAVLAATAPERPVHLLGHDWGSVQGWYLLGDPRLAGRIASFTSISGPSLDQVRPWLLRELRAGHLAPVLRQLAHSAYIPFFLLPVLPELAWRSGLLDRLLGGRSGRGSTRLLTDKLHGLELYRANLLRSGSGSASGRGRAGTIDVPVQVLAPSRDRYVTAELQLFAPRPYVRQFSGRTAPGGHWLPVSQPELVATAVSEFVARVSGDQAGDGGPPG